MSSEKYWKDFKGKGCPRAKEALILEYIPLVKYIAHRMAINLPGYIMVEDIINDGILGLIQSVETFDISREIDFKAYASFRIRGSILDALRSFDWAPRSLRRKSRELKDTLAELEGSLGRAPSMDEVAEHLHMNIENLDKLLSNIGSTAVLSLDAWLSGSEDGNTFKDVYQGSELSPEVVFDRKEFVKTMGSAIDKLPDKEKLVITLYYYEELTLKEIAKVLNLSESRISQLHTRAVLRIKGNMKDYFSFEDKDLDKNLI
jgi:RNA polymerase sigma factor for flagellar operon FliA